MNLSRLVACLPWAVLLPGAFAAAPQEAAPASPLAEVLQEARRRNPELRAAREEWQAAQARVSPQGSWRPPQIGVEYWGFRGADFGTAPERWYDVGQDIPFPGKLRLRSEGAVHEAHRLEEVYKGVELDLTARVKSAYYRYRYACDADRILKENAEVMRRFLKTAEARYATGKASQSDVLRAQVELSKTLAALLTLDQEKVSNQAKLNALLDKSPREPLGAAQDPDLAPLRLSEDDLERAALSHRPEVAAADHHASHRRSELRAQRAEYLPDFSLQYTRRTRDGMPDDSVAVVRMSLPFLYFWRQRSETQAAAAEVRQAEDMLRSERAAAASDVQERWSKVQAVGRLVDLYRTGVIPQAEQSVAVAEAAYAAGRMDFLSLLDSQRALLEFRLDEDRYVSEYGESVAELERAVGTDLESIPRSLPEEPSHDQP